MAEEVKEDPKTNGELNTVDMKEVNGSGKPPDVKEEVVVAEPEKVVSGPILEAPEVPLLAFPNDVDQTSEAKYKNGHPSRTQSPNRSRNRNRGRSADSRGRDRNSNEERPVPKVVHKIEYRHVSSNAVVFEEESDRFAPSKPPPEEPVLEVITIAFTAQDRSPYSYRHDVIKPPPIHSMGHTYVQVNSAAVINALRNVVEYYPGQNLIGDSITISEPYTILVHHEQELAQYREMFAPGSRGVDDEPCEVEEDTYEHLGIVLDFLSKTMKDSMEKERARHARDKPLATYEMLWTLYKPGTNVYFDSQSAGIFDSFVVKNVSWEINNGAPVRYNIGLWNLYYDSIHIGPRNHHAVVLPFDGEKEIGSLDIFPCEYLREDLHKETAEAMQKRLEERGKVFFKLTSKQCMWYDGLTTTFPRQKFTGTVMVDAESFWASLQEKSGSKSGSPSPPPLISDDVGERTIGGIPTCFCKRCVKLNSSKKKSKFADYARINPMTQKELTPHQYWLCDRSVWGFIMKVRAWHRLDAANFSAAKFDTTLMNDLVLASDTKNLIKLLSKKYARETPAPAADAPEADHWAADFVQGKGEGMIFLLHGKPGVGKTYTAECVAEYTRRPLLSLTCTDIGTNPLVIESKLAYWFKLAKHWGTILLIDEADIYMEHRKTRDLERNNLVAGFLRAMEYYQGILFLTTNRVGTFDDAFISRIHVSIHYPEFSEADRKEVWISFFRKLEAEKGDKMVVCDDVKTYVTDDKDMRVVKWNGREIRNAFQTAVALAEVEDEKVSADDDRVVLKMSHIESIVKMSANFKTYLNTLHQGDETKRAAREGLRVDDFEEAVEREKKGFAHYM
ncbi:P-loop containing nucleoside triphosphate hydrolase protein [Pseudovirgaria hyperparasitica]|uniref:P-loop containing nucleoside triphosphate hydrolase protein n=1 Tax=Pseudovirgaria hyperparasitica TaxID=470096 RepID=A0A6A6WFY9_9PEZI|nr:P-loop containing nucleoside triphosphate hydrolase protein [Pseudovirgaria hyperparasitica]KAF2760974.1 P-loop containing nucleoside triphosphate hydrolase protein [Pseudovirgaria hyperparasitica]